MHLTIERLRTIVLIAGALLVIAIALFLGISHWRNLSKTTDLPQRLGVNITQQADHVIYTQSHAGHTLFKIDAAKVVQVKNGVATLSDVAIDLYSADGSQADRIVGSQFEYDKSTGIARAVGPVEITLMKPGQAPAIAPRSAQHVLEETSSKKTVLSTAVATAETGNIRVKTSGLVFDQKTGVAQTTERADFILPQGTGSGIGALFDSQQGHMLLDHQVELHIQREQKNDSVGITLLASHAEFERGSMLCHLRNANLNERSTTVQTADAAILFRDDGSADYLDASGGLTLSSTKGSTLTAPRGHLDFDTHNHPQRGHLDDGVTFDSKDSRADSTGKLNRQMHGTSPSAQLVFTALGDLHTAHLERGVDFNTIENREQNNQNNLLQRHWSSPIADLEFQKNAKGAVVLKSIHGLGGTTIKGESQRTLLSASAKPGPILPSRISADDLFGNFNGQGAISSLSGNGHAQIEETTEAGAHQLATGDKLDAHFVDEPHAQSQKNFSASGLSNLDHATITGHVVLVQTPALNSASSANHAPIRATSGRADYEGSGEWLHLTLSPHIENGGIEITADRIDVSRASGDAFAHSNVKATWVSEKSSASSSAKPSTPGLGSQAPTHVISTEAELHQSSSEAIFRTQARIWQGNNSVSAPVIILNREKQTLLAEGTSSKAEAASNKTDPPVYAVFLSASESKSSAQNQNTHLMRFHGAHLKYSSTERKAWLTNSDANSAVTADTGSCRLQSDSMELILLPIGVTSATPGNEASSSQVDRIIARGHVQLNSEGRHGAGEQLVYNGETGDNTITGTAARPPTFTDSSRGTVTGETLIFNGRTDSVKVEGHGTHTETSTQK